MPQPETVGSRILGQGKWLRLEELDYRDRTGNLRTWESAARRGNARAVLMIPVLRPSERYVLIRQYRPPVGRYVVEFPAGLMDAGEPPEQTAVRELLEETGYTGSVRHCTEFTCSSPGMTGEAVILALVDIDENLPENRNPKPRLEAGEDIEVFTVGRGELQAFMHRQKQQGDAPDSRTAAFFLGLGIAW